MATVRMIGGREIEIPTDSDGRADVQQVREVFDVPPNRALIRQTSQGQNIVVPKQGKIPINPYDYFLEVPRAIRGVNYERHNST